MTDEEKKALRRVHLQLGHVLKLAAMPKKTETALLAVYHEIGLLYIVVPVAGGMVADRDDFPTRLDQQTH